MRTREHTAHAGGGSVPAVFTDMLGLADKSWRPVLKDALEAVARTDPSYLPALAEDVYLPTQGRLFAAFSLPMDSVRHILVGEGPYPREESATGFCFMDGAVTDLWSEKGFSKPVNRATSLRNFMKMLLVAEDLLDEREANSEHVARISMQARSRESGFIQTREELQRNLLASGFLLLNASLVFRPHVPPVKDARAWLPFLQVVLSELSQHRSVAKQSLPVLVLWGKIAEAVNALPEAKQFPQEVSEHPYNITFIRNSSMQALFAPMHLLRRH
jgi:uracil-DNA glycosylase